MGFHEILYWIVLIMYSNFVKIQMAVTVYILSISELNIVIFPDIEYKLLNIYHNKKYFQNIEKIGRVFEIHYNLFL
jgi:hypothetical protein